uniref:Uncharacterized protein n=1 Tax=Musa acuminata subsp. malaccensis TaxID=214687 RepID=A0A804J862_MUSAM
MKGQQQSSGLIGNPRTSSPAILPASFVAWRCALLK